MRRGGDEAREGGKTRYNVCMLVKREREREKEMRYTQIQERKELP